MDNVIVIGGGGHAKVLISILKKLGSRHILGYTDLNNKGPILGIQYLGNDEAVSRIRQTKRVLNAAIGIGNTGLSDKRIVVSNLLKSLDISMPPIVSPDSVINEASEVGDGSVVFDGAVVNTGAQIGECCIINTNSTVEHDCHIGSNVHIAPGACLSGNVHIGDNSLIGTGVVVIQNITISSNTVVGAGAVVVSDLEGPGVYVGIPAVRIK